MRISLVRISLLQFFKTWLMPFRAIYFITAILLAKNLPNAILFAIYFVTAII